MRHPETEYNISRKLSGRLDVNLSEKGVGQAQRAARALVAWKPDRIISSPLKRCHAIADPAAAELGLEVIDDERLIEINFGEVEGVVKDTLPEMGLAFPWEIRDGASVAAPGAESFEDILERSDECAVLGLHTRSYYIAQEVFALTQRRIGAVYIHGLVLQAHRGVYVLRSFELCNEKALVRTRGNKLYRL